MPNLIALPRVAAHTAFLLALLALPSSSAWAQSTPAQTSNHALAERRVRAAIEAMGGEAALRALRGVRLETVGHVNALEQSDRFEGPYIVQYEQRAELRDLGTGRLRQTTQRRNFQSPQFRGNTLVVADGVASYEFRAPDGSTRSAPGRATDVLAAERERQLAPERVLLTALDAPDLHAGRDTVYYGVPQHVVGFAAKDGRVRLFLDAHTALPTAVETQRAETEDFFWNVWGDVTLRTILSLWTLEPDGLLYPRQWDVQWNGTLYHSTTVTALDLHAAVPADSFAIGDSARAAYRAAVAQTSGPRTIALGEQWGSRRSAGPIEELKPGVIFIPGGYNVVLVRQPDGIVVIEAPFSQEYAAKVLAEVARRYPGERVKAVVSTGDAWTYAGGVREYVARGVPVYALGLNRPILEQMLRAPHALAPDSLARAPRRPDFRWVNGKTVLGAGPNRLELYPVNGEGGERMMLAYFPEHRLLWTTDLVQGGRSAGTFFMPSYLLDVQRVVEREGLAVETAFGMHRTPLPWRTVTAALEALKRPSAGAAGQ
jgi:hypothetical protein